MGRSFNKPRGCQTIIFMFFLVEIFNLISWIVVCCRCILLKIDGSEVVVFTAKRMTVVMYWWRNGEIYEGINYMRCFFLA